MKRKKDLYLIDFAVVVGIGVVHSFSYPMGLHNNSTYNGVMLGLGLLYWAGQLFYHVWSKRHNYQWSSQKTPLQWGHSVALVGLCLLYWMAPLTFALDFKMTESEGALSFVFLSLGLVPYRYFADSFWIGENHVETVSEDEDFPLAS